MKNRLHMDFESYSDADIETVGAYRYAADDSTRVLCCAFAFDDDEPVVWFPGMENPEVIEPYFAALRDPSILIFAHNCMFERAMFEYVAADLWDIPYPEVSRFHCTASLARRASLPAKLETLAEVLELPQKKDSRGKSLIRKFSMMQPAKKPTKKNPDGVPPRRILPEEEPEAFKEFLEYCRQDVVVERLCFKKLEYFFSPINNSNYSLDAVINARGVPVNLSALRHAQVLIDEETALVTERFRQEFGFNPTQGEVFLEWLKGEGADLTDLQKETIENFLEDK